MEPLLQIVKTLLGPAGQLLGWLQNRANPARRQAARILEAFEAHGIERTQINRLLPAELQLSQFELSTPDELKKVIRQPLVDWTRDFLALEQNWLDGTSTQAHTLIDSYKNPAALHRWLQAQSSPDQQGCQFRLYLVTSDKGPITARSSADFAVVLEAFINADDSSLRRYYHLTDGAHFDHYPCVLHLMQILALANFHQLIPWRRVMPAGRLFRFGRREGLIPEQLQRCEQHPLHADHEFWAHFSGDSPWLVQLRQHTEASLLQAGLQEVVASINHDRQRFARSRQADGCPVD